MAERQQETGTRWLAPPPAVPDNWPDTGPGARARKARNLQMLMARGPGSVRRDARALAPPSTGTQEKRQQMRPEPGGSRKDRARTRVASTAASAETQARNTSIPEISPCSILETRACERPRAAASSARGHRGSGNLRAGPRRAGHAPSWTRPGRLPRPHSSRARGQHSPAKTPGHPASRPQPI